MDAVLSELIADLSRSHIQGLFDIGAVSINGEQTDSKKYKARAGDVVDVTVPEPETLKIEAQDNKEITHIPVTLKKKELEYVQEHIFPICDACNIAN